MARQYDVIVVGLGGMGSAAAYHLAARGQRVLGLEQFTPAHDLGSSHGRSRIIRQAYFEHPAYVPLVLRAYELWEQLARDVGVDLLRITGGLMLGGPDSTTVRGSMVSAEQHGLEYEVLDADAIRQRSPPFRPPPETVAVFERAAGVLNPELAVTAHLRRAAALGAELLFDQRVLRWQASADESSVRVTTERAEYEAARLVIAPGAWASQVLAELGLPLQVERQVQFWFQPRGGVEPFLPDRFPIYVWELPGGPSIYGFPALGRAEEGVKAAIHHGGQTCSPDTIDRQVREEEIAQMRGLIVEVLPSLAGICLQALTCMYTNTPDRHFAIGPHPRHPAVVFAAGFSGHGFKFVPVVGEILADLALEGSTRHPISLFAPQRFAAHAVAG